MHDGVDVEHTIAAGVAQSWGHVHPLPEKEHLWHTKRPLKLHLQHVCAS